MDFSLRVGIQLLEARDAASCQPPAAVRFHPGQADLVPLVLANQIVRGPVASSAIGNIPAMWALPLRVCMARYGSSLAGNGNCWLA